MTDPNQPPSAPQVPPAYQAPPAAPPVAPPVAPVPPPYPQPTAAQPPAPQQVPPVPTAPGYQAPPVPTAPGYQAPPGAYGVPVGGYQVQAPGGYDVPSTTSPRSTALGLSALIAALVAAIVTPILAGIMAYQIGASVPDAVTSGTMTDVSSLAVLSPVRTQVLWAEISFWVGTVLGLFAIVAGIIAIAKRRGRGLGIAALIVAVLGPIIYFVVLAVMLSIGASAGMMDTLGGV